MLQENKINLSIVIPVYNEERYLKTLFLDLKKYFNLKNVEIIFINDGSTDRSQIILEEFQTSSRTEHSLLQLKI